MMLTLAEVEQVLSGAQKGAKHGLKGYLSLARKEAYAHGWSQRMVDQCFAPRHWVAPGEPLGTNPEAPPELWRAIAAWCLTHPCLDWGGNARSDIKYVEVEGSPMAVWLEGLKTSDTPEDDTQQQVSAVAEMLAHTELMARCVYDLQSIVKQLED